MIDRFWSAGFKLREAQAYWSAGQKKEAFAATREARKLCPELCHGSKLTGHQRLKVAEGKAQ